VGDNSHSHELLSVVATVHHERVGETLDDWALCLSESLLCVTSGGVGDVDWCADLNVIAEDLLVFAYCPSKYPHISPIRRFRISYVNEISRISTSSYDLVVN